MRTKLALDRHALYIVYTEHDLEFWSRVTLLLKGHLQHFSCDIDLVSSLISSKHANIV